MRAEVRSVDGVDVLTMQGKLVAGVGDVLLREKVNEMLGEKAQFIVVNLAEVTAIDSSGVGELVASRRIVERFGAKLALVRASASVDRILGLSQLLPLFDIYEDEESAIEGVRKAAE